MTTNFNNSQPKTYGAYIPPIPNIDLPKINFNKISLNKSPQLPPYVRQSTSNVPPLPVTAPPLPVTASNTQSNTYHHQSSVFTCAIPPLTYSNQSKSYGQMGNNIRNTSSYNINHNQNSNLYVSDVKTKPILPPPLPMQTISVLNLPNFNNSILSTNNPVMSACNSASTSSNSSTTSLLQNSPSSSGSHTQQQSTSKKGQAKVKFSDTVTAFIVPEIKRPARPALPAHVMDPQKELADSLPLCHPNEDYLKDFAPIKRNENEENTPAPKIKVVHFGVV